MNPVQALARIAMEASAVSLWLCSHNRRWEERLQRFSQLHLRTMVEGLKAMGIYPSDPPDPSTVNKNVTLSIEHCNTLMAWVGSRGWTCRRRKMSGKKPTIRTWVREIPAYSDVMKRAADIIVGIPPRAPEEALRHIQCLSAYQPGHRDEWTQQS